MEKVEIEEDDKEVVPSEKHYADFEPAAPPISPDGGIAMGFAVESPRAPPAVTAENFVCLRGPCRHYWHMVTMSGAGNPEGTWAALGLSEPRQHHHTCLVNPGMETSINDDCVFVCNRWDPIAPHDLVQLNTRRRAYYETAKEFALEDNQADEAEGDG